MKKKRETVQLRIEKELKDQLTNQAEQMGISPSEFIRRLIKMGVGQDPDKIKRLEKGERDLRAIALEIMTILQKMLIKKSWTEARKTFQDSGVGITLEQELYIRYSKIDRLDLYYKARDELFRE